MKLTFKGKKIASVIWEGREEKKKSVLAMETAVSQQQATDRVVKLRGKKTC